MGQMGHGQALSQMNKLLSRLHINDRRITHADRLAPLFNGLYQRFT